MAANKKEAALVYPVGLKNILSGIYYGSTTNNNNTSKGILTNNNNKVSTNSHILY